MFKSVTLRLQYTVWWMHYIARSMHAYLYSKHAALIYIYIYICSRVRGSEDIATYLINCMHGSVQLANIFLSKPIITAWKSIVAYIVIWFQN